MTHDNAKKYAPAERLLRRSETKSRPRGAERFDPQVEAQTQASRPKAEATQVGFPLEASFFSLTDKVTIRDFRAPRGLGAFLRIVVVGALAGVAAAWFHGPIIGFLTSLTALFSFAMIAQYAIMAGPVLGAIAVFAALFMLVRSLDL